MNDEDILSAHVVIHFNEDFTVVKAFNTRIDKVDTHPAVHRHAAGDRGRERLVCITRNELGIGEIGHEFGPWQPARV